MGPQVLYEASFTIQKGWLILLVLFVAFSCIAVHHLKRLKNPRKYGTKDAKAGVIVGVLGTLFLIAVMAFVVPDQIRMYQCTVGAYEHGEYRIVEGYVEQYKPAQKVGKGESFSIDGVDFEYYDNVVQFGYHKTSALGGVITGDGQHLRVGYTQYRSLGNVIVYIEELP